MKDRGYIPPDIRSPDDPWLVRCIDALMDWWGGILDRVIATHPANADIDRMAAIRQASGREFRRKYPDEAAMGAEDFLRDYPGYEHHFPSLVAEVARRDARAARRERARKRRARARKTK